MAEQQKPGSANNNLKELSCSQTQVKPQPYATNSESHLSDNVPERCRVVTTMPERECVESEAGEGRKAAEHSDEHKRSHH
jgi:hypothetical protein